MVENPTFATTFDRNCERVYFVEMASDSRAESVELGVVSTRVRFVVLIFSVRAGAVNIHSSMMAAVNRDPHRCGNIVVEEAFKSRFTRRCLVFLSIGLGYSAS